MRGTGIGPRGGFFDKQGEVCGRTGIDRVPAAKRIPDGLISALTGLTRQAVNRLKNIYPERIEHSFYLLMAFRNARNKVATHSQ